MYITVGLMECQRGVVPCVTGAVHVTTDLRGHEWTFGRDLPKILPAREPVTSPWTVTSIA